jgi:hypothetical protein
VVTGNDLDNNNLSHGFIRQANGHMVPLEAGAGTTRCASDPADCL